MDFQTQQDQQSSQPINQDQSTAIQEPMGSNGNNNRKTIMWVIIGIIIIIIAIGAWFYLFKLIKPPVVPQDLNSALQKIPPMNPGNEVSDIEQNLNTLIPQDKILDQELDSLGKDIINF